MRSRRLAGFYLATLIVLVAAPSPRAARAESRPRDVMSAAELQLAIQKLRVLGSVLYVAAHPDDENTAFITYLESGRLARVGYLSMTRGSGGQNLIGPETGEALGVIRTQELLAARAIDGAEQFFTRAIDFGYSKTSDETMSFWGREAILSDVVWTIRTFRPDVIVTRFPLDARGGHGHHQASAILAKEAFAAAADPKRFPEQLRQAPPWRAKRILWNAFRPDTGKRDPALPKLLTVDLGAYNPLLGKSHTELSAASRSMHKSQGFGAAERRGPVPNFLELLDGEPATDDLFDGVKTGWSRISRGGTVDSILAEAEKEFDPNAPQRIVPLLIRARAAMRAMGTDPWVLVKRRELDDVIRSCAGLWMEAIAARPFALSGGSVPVNVSLLSRSDLAVTLSQVASPSGAVLRDTVDSTRSLANRALARNIPVEGTVTVPLPKRLLTTQPHWLRQRPGAGAYQTMRAGTTDSHETETPDEAENRPALLVRFELEILGERIVYDVPVLYRWTDRVAGERYRPLEVVPPVTLRLDQSVYLFAEATPREVKVIVETPGPSVSGRVRLDLPAGWQSTPAETTISVRGADEPGSARFWVRPGERAGSGLLAASMSVGGARHDKSRSVIDYPHIPVTTLFPPAEAHLVRADVKRTGSRVGYVMGSGDEIPAALDEMGYAVTLVSDDDIESGALAGFDAVVVGIRAYNTRPRLRSMQDHFLDYVSAGGTMVVQYNTVEEGLQDKLGPYPFKLSRERVTVEASPVRLLKPEHPLLRAPNAIGAGDFDGWVQERGLYFAKPWDAAYETVLSMNDPGEEPMEGSLLFAPFGKGAYVYTGIAWFRQLPAGVPGAYRLFANLVAGGKE
ncbi:MAG: PIG-L family deacetylase [Candidatus Eisenbacteria bacterium]